MNRRLSLRRRNGRETNKTEEDNPPVICIDKDEQAEMGLNQSTSKNNSLAEERPSSQDRNCSSSPILFPSQEETKDEKVVKEDEDDCLEIVDKNECADDTKEMKMPNNGIPSHSRMQMSKGKTLLSVGKKRHQQVEIDCEFTDGNEVNRSKQRKLICEENDSIIKHVESNVSHERESLAMEHPLLLRRTYKCEHRVCRTLEEADKMDLYFAPQGVKQTLYSRVIVRKFEDYRQRLSKAQSRLMHFHPCGEPIEPAPVAVPTRRQTVRAKRTSVLMKTTHELHDLLDGNKDTIDLVENLGESKECNVDVNEQQPALEIIRDNGHTDTNTTENARTPPLTTNSPPQKGVGLKIDNDVIESTPNIDNSLESPESSSQPSPIKARLNKNLARSILEDDTSSDEDRPSFSLRKPEPPEQQPKAKQESVIVLSNEKAPSTSDATRQPPQVPHLECPMCFKMFPEDKIEIHAAGCNGSYEMATRSARDTPSLDEDEGAECQGVSQRPDEVVVRGKTKEQKMSPIIKVRTPTKVRELKLLSPNIAVRNLAHEFSSQPKPGERVQIFGVNVMLSPKAPCVASESETSSADVREVDFRQAKTDRKWLNARKSGSKTPDAQDSTQIPHRESAAPTASTKSTKNVKRSWDDKSIKKDFLPLQVWRDDFDDENHEDNSLPSKNVREQTSFVTSISSSEEELDEKVVCASSKTFNDVDALDLLINGYKGKKRKGKNVGEQTGRKRHKKPEEDRVELCTICQKYIPIENYTQHVEEELAQKRKECQIVDCEVSTSPRHEPDTSTSSNNLKSRNSKQDGTNQRKHMLPDFAEATMSNVSQDDGHESPLKTFMPLDRFPNPNVDYYNQFSTKTSTFESAGPSRGRGRPRKKRLKKRKQKK